MTLNGGWEWAKRVRLLWTITAAVFGVAAGVFWMGFRTNDAVHRVTTLEANVATYETENGLAHSDILTRITKQGLRVVGLQTGVDSLLRKQSTVICMLDALANERPVPRTCGLR